MERTFLWNWTDIRQLPLSVQFQRKVSLLVIPAPAIIGVELSSIYMYVQCWIASFHRQR
jgi:hypothetical protein